MNETTQQIADRPIEDPAEVYAVLADQCRALGLSKVADDWFVGDGKKYRVCQTFSHGELRLRLREWNPDAMRHQTVRTRDVFLPSFPLERGPLATKIAESLGYLLDAVNAGG